MMDMNDDSVIDLSDNDGTNDDSMDANEGLLTTDESNDDSIEGLNNNQEEIEAVPIELKQEAEPVEVKNWRETYDVSDHVTTTIGGVDVTFPFPPYPIQKAYMSKVLACIKNKTNGLLESPTGTGKTLSLLCSSGAWLRTEIEKFNRLEEAYLHGTDSDLENLVSVLGDMADADVNVQFLNEMMAAPSGSNGINDHSSTNDLQSIGNGFPKSKSGLPKVQVVPPGGDGDGISSVDSGMSSLNGDTGSDAPEKGKGGRKMKPRRPRVVYASRTHDQLSQSMKELKRSAYRDIPAVILASKDHLCVNPDVMRLGTLNEKNSACRDVRLNKKCPYYQTGEKRKMEKVKKMIHQMGRTTGPVMDIEDMITAGNKVKCCPYYAAPEIAMTKASIIFTPYNYLLDSRLRNGSKIPVRNSVIIFDEGHNIEGSCEDSASSEIRLTNLITVRDGINEFIGYLRDGLVDTTRDSVIADLSIQDLTDMEQLVNDLISNIKRYVSTSSRGQLKESTSSRDQLKQSTSSRGHLKESGNEKMLYPQTQWLVDLFNRIGGLERGHAIINTLDRIASYVNDTKLPMVVPRVGFVTACDKLQEFVDKMFPPEMKLMESLDKFYAHFNRKYKIALEVDIHSQDDSDGSTTYGTSAYFKKGKGRKGRNQTTDFSLKLLCCSPSVTMNRLISAGTRSIIVTSGTLAPMTSYPHDMEMEFKEILQNNHVIKSDQLMVFPVPGFRATIFDSSYKNRENLTYYKAIGEALKEYVSRIPGGILLFFPSYTFKMKCQELWKEWNLLDAIQQVKPIFDEPKNRAEFSGILSSFRDAIDTDGARGAILTGVFRGKLSEGLDLKDKYCRTTIVIGLPYPALKEPKITLKRQYLDKERIISLTSSTWYELQMLRAVNQAIGRIIRHKNDYGLILLLDHRYNQEKIQNGLSKWLQKYIRSPKEVKGTVFDKFFHDNFIREERMAFGIPGTPSDASWDEESGSISGGGGVKITEEKSEPKKERSEPKKERSEPKKERSEPKEEKDIYTGSTITLSGTSTDDQVIDGDSEQGYSTNSVPTVTNGLKNDLFSKPSSLDWKVSTSGNSSLLSDVSFSTGDSSMSIVKVSSGDSSMSFDLNLNEVDTESPVVAKKTQRKSALSKFVYKGEPPLIEIGSSQESQNRDLGVSSGRSQESKDRDLGVSSGRSQESKDRDLDVSNGSAHKKLKTETSTPKALTSHVSNDQISTFDTPNVDASNSNIPNVRTSTEITPIVNSSKISSLNKKGSTAEMSNSRISTDGVSSRIPTLSDPNIDIPNGEIPNSENDLNKSNQVIDLTDDDFLNDSFDDIDTSVITANAPFAPIVAPPSSVKKSGNDPSSSQGSIEWEEVDDSIFNCIN